MRTPAEMSFLLDALDVANCLGTPRHLPVLLVHLMLKSRVPDPPRTISRLVADRCMDAVSSKEVRIYPYNFGVTDERRRRMFGVRSDSCNGLLLAWSLREKDLEKDADLNRWRSAWGEGIVVAPAMSAEARFGQVLRLFFEAGRSGFNPGRKRSPSLEIYDRLLDQQGYPQVYKPESSRKRKPVTVWIGPIETREGRTAFSRGFKEVRPSSAAVRPVSESLHCQILRDHRFVETVNEELYGKCPLLEYTSLLVFERHNGDTISSRGQRQRWRMRGEMVASEEGKYGRGCCWRVADGILPCIASLGPSLSRSEAESLIALGRSVAERRRRGSRAF